MTSEAETMVERIARAMEDELARSASVQNSEFLRRDECGLASANMHIEVDALARAVLTALLDPTEAMVEAGATAVAPAIMDPSSDDPAGMKDGCRQDAADSFRAMIQAALQPGSKDKDSERG